MRGEVVFSLSHRSAATRLALAFVAWSAIWVVFSDYLVNVLAPPLNFWRLQTEKGLVYVAVSGLLIWFSIRAMEHDEVARRALNEFRLKCLRESGLIGVAGRTAGGTIIYVNEKAGQMLGYRYYVRIGQKISRLVSHKYAHIQEQAENELRDFGRTSLVEVELLRKDGSLVPIVGGRAALAGTDGEEIIYFVDVTKLRQSEEARKQL